MSDSQSGLSIMDYQLMKVTKAYDLTVEHYHQGLDPLSGVPVEIRNTAFFTSLAEGKEAHNSGNPEIAGYLDPQTGMRFLDAGCSANLFNYRLDHWASTYYGIDISPRLIAAMRNFAESEKMTIGGLCIAEVSRLPFAADVFDIAAMIGVLEYCTIDHVRKVLTELSRVMKPESRVVLDIPNSQHPFARDMAELEKFLERPIFLHSRERFEELLKPCFQLIKIDTSQVMTKYFLKTTQ
jgi:SAM-dependent methyltransferase